ncbi:hypothetical protein KGM_202996 [Danaus plexippus plexippus]|uniref:Uncharacterized protein n=1 Tax=Danaus plexippus plexippus TaxID=278856 RepID=A0A212EKE3_DANPL|nr:hypothetical protein KGM_202996 [Danaus plexippus plexippus]
MSVFVSVLCPSVTVLCRHCDVCANSGDVRSHAQIRPLSAPVYPSYTGPLENTPYRDDRELKIDATYVVEHLNHCDVSEEFSTSGSYQKNDIPQDIPSGDWFLVQ